MMPANVNRRGERSFVLAVKEGLHYFEKKFTSIFRADMAFQSFAQSGIDCALFVEEDGECIESYGYVAIDHYQGQHPKGDRRPPIVAGNWQADESCAHKRRVETCLECLRFENGECRQATQEYEIYLKRRKNGTDS